MRQSETDLQSWENDPEVDAMIDRVHELSDAEVADLYRRIGVRLDLMDVKTRFLISALEDDMPSATIRETLRASDDLDHAIRRGVARPN
jgi:hypothetical protein